MTHTKARYVTNDQTVFVKHNNSFKQTAQSYIQESLDLCKCINIVFQFQCIIL